jgi:hypothetical protein
MLGLGLNIWLPAVAEVGGSESDNYAGSTSQYAGSTGDYAGATA